MSIRIVFLVFLFLGEDLVEFFFREKRRIFLSFFNLFYLVQLGKGTEDRKAAVKQGQVYILFLLAANQFCRFEGHKVLCAILSCSLNLRADWPQQLRGEPEIVDWFLVKDKFFT